MALGTEGTGRRLALSTYLWFTGDKQGAEDLLNTFSDPEWNDLIMAGVELPFNVRRVSQVSQGEGDQNLHIDDRVELV